MRRVENEGDAVRATVVKDGGDDPDATHGAEIQAVARLFALKPATRSAEQGARPVSVRIEGGTGVGRVTLPGLPVAVGHAAINPAPLAQIERGILEALPASFTGEVHVVVEVPEGEKRAKKTMNPRLGIVGGISILGTSGIVRPYSHDSWRATITQGLDVALAQGLCRATLTTGRRSERLYLLDHPEVPEHGCVQAADFFAFSMREAARRGFRHVDWAVFFGKLVKQAQGLDYTHARDNAVDFHLLARRAQQAGADPAAVAAIGQAVTARHVLELLGEGEVRQRLVADLAGRAAANALHFARRAVPEDEISDGANWSGASGEGDIANGDTGDGGDKNTLTRTVEHACIPKVRYFVYDFDGTRLFPL